MYTQDQARDAVIAAIQAICQRGYALGTSGNVSVRTHEDAFVITPSSRPYPCLLYTSPLRRCAVG